MTVSKAYYSNLSVEELIQDDYFIQSAKRPDERSESFWNDFLQQYPHKASDFEEARAFVNEMKFFEQQPSQGTRERVWNNIIAAGAEQAAVVIPMTRRRRWLQVAAAVAGFILLAAGWMLFNNNRLTSVRTQFAEVKQVILPDQSVVTLNANSSIEYKKKWKEGKVREVWLKGEAFFDVKHLHKAAEVVKESDRFIVHSRDAEVEVLGTSFNVSDRQAVTKVVLQTGKIKVNFKDKSTGSLVMEPGDVVKYDQQSKRLVKEKAETEKYVSWKEKEFLLNNTSVEEVISVIENTFGYKVVVENADLLNRQLSGTGKVSLENEETLFRSLELMLEVSITKTKDTLYIKKK